MAGLLKNGRFDTFAKRGQKTVVALCASINQMGNRFFSRVKEQPGEIGECLQPMFEDAFDAFKN
jgi:hypothetical protein